MKKARMLRSVLVAARQVDAARRALPHFLIIGTQKGGTTSLFSYLSQHPDVVEPIQKEVHFFTRTFHRGMRFYRAHFPATKPGQVTGEATPYYLYHPRVPERVAAELPGARMIALLRDPADRAYSHYWHSRRYGRETATFEEAIAREREVIPREHERILADDTYVSPSHQHWSYLARGHYAEQIRSWRRYFGPEQLLLLRSEDLFSDPATVCRNVLEFLGLRHHAFDGFEVMNAQRYPAPLRPETEQFLHDYYAPHIADLERETGRTWWQSKR
jgi:hypothetical protein